MNRIDGLLLSAAAIHLAIGAPAFAQMSTPGAAGSGGGIGKAPHIPSCQATGAG